MPNDTFRLEYAAQRKLRDRNKLGYRFAHWPIWIAVFYLVPGPATFQLFAGKANVWMAAWLGIVMTVKIVSRVYSAGYRVLEPRPYHHPFH